MKTAAIIAEYNPFHNGHAYHIQRTRQLSGADYVLVLMSPDYVQRGEPAVTDKYTRTQMALKGGADVVLELPVRYACGSAQFFAEGAVRILHGLSCMDLLSFGCETDDLHKLGLAASILDHEPEAFTRTLRDALAAGSSYPAALEKALDHSLPKEEAVDAASLLCPNNILAIEYIRAAMRFAPELSLLPVRREGMPYLDQTLSEDEVFVSAMAIREHLRRHVKDGADDAVSSLASWIPGRALKVLQESLRENGLPDQGQFSAMMHHALMAADQANVIHTYPDVSDELANRIRHSLGMYTQLDTYVDLLHTKNLTRARVKRALLHILLNITADEPEAEGSTAPHWVRLLGMRRSAAPLMHRIQKEAGLCVITKTADVKKLLDQRDADSFYHDMRCSALYQSILRGGTLQSRRSEYTRSPVVIS